MCDPFFGPCPDPVVDEPVVDDTPVEEPMENMEEWEAEDNYEMELAPNKGMIAFATTAVVGALSVALRLFRYRSITGFYDGGEMGGKTNYWKFANLIEGYGVLAVLSIAAITQLLSFAGIAVGLNILVWTFGVGFGGAIISGVAGLLRFLAYDQEFSNKDDVAKYSSGIKGAAKLESVYAGISGSALSLMFLMEYKNWLYGQYLALSPEDQKAWREGDMEDEEMAEEMTEEGEGEEVETEAELFWF